MSEQEIYETLPGTHGIKHYRKTRLSTVIQTGSQNPQENSATSWGGELPTGDSLNALFVMHDYNCVFTKNWIAPIGGQKRSGELHDTDCAIRNRIECGGHLSAVKL